MGDSAAVCWAGVQESLNGWTGVLRCKGDGSYHVNESKHADQWWTRRNIRNKHIYTCTSKKMILRFPRRTGSLLFKMMADLRKGRVFFPNHPCMNTFYQLMQKKLPWSILCCWALDLRHFTTERKSAFSLIYWFTWLIHLQRNALTVNTPFLKHPPIPRNLTRGKGKCMACLVAINGLGHGQWGSPSGKDGWMLVDGWWQLKDFWNFQPIPGKMIQFGEHIFQMGWNHQLVFMILVQTDGALNMLFFGTVKKSLAK